MDPQVKTLWITALRSGGYTQGKGALRQNIDPNNPNLKDQFCCLGVLCDLAVRGGVIPEPDPNGGEDIFGQGPIPVAHKIYRYGVPGEEDYTVAGIDTSTGYLPDKVVEWAGLRGRGGNSVRLPDAGYESLVQANDKGASFATIARLVEEYL